ncbi:MAG: hypothetical protein E4H20_11815, partial [Spirochaetales bacterium]
MKNDDLLVDGRIAAALVEFGGEGLAAHVSVLVKSLVGDGRNVTAGIRLGEGALPVLGAVTAQWLISN